MNKISIKNCSKLFSFSFKNSKKVILGWSICIFLLMFLYMILFPSMKDMAQIKFDSMPEEMLQFMGMKDMSDMGNFVTYFGMIFNIIIVAISIFSATFSSGLLYKEEKTKSIEFLYSLNVSRSEIYISKLVNAFLGVIIVIACGTVSTVICGYINGGDTFNLIDVLSIIKLSGFTAIFFVSISFLISAISAKIGVPTISSMIVLLCYMMGYLGSLLGDKAEWLKYLSPFEMFKPEKALELSNETLIAFAVYFCIMVAAIIAGCIVYNKRDYNI